MKKKSKKILLVTFIVTAIFLLLRTEINAPEKAGDTPSIPTLPKVTYRNATHNDIVIDSPVAGEIVAGTISLSGKARGPWYFEGSFPILLKSGEIVVASGIAKATSNWMTTEFVPFTANLTLPNNYKGNAMLLFKKDNPSGLPEKDGSVSLPIIIAHPFISE